MTNEYKLQSKLQVIQNTAYRPNTMASYTVGLGTIIQENQPGAQIVASIFTQMVPYHLCPESFGAGRN